MLDSARLRPGGRWTLHGGALCAQPTVHPVAPSALSCHPHLPFRAPRQTLLHETERLSSLNTWWRCNARAASASIQAQYVANVSLAVLQINTNRGEHQKPRRPDSDLKSSGEGGLREGRGCGGPAGRRARRRRRWARCAPGTGRHLSGTKASWVGWRKAIKRTLRARTPRPRRRGR